MIAQIRPPIGLKWSIAASAWVRHCWCSGTSSQPQGDSTFIIMRKFRFHLIVCSGCDFLDCSIAFAGHRLARDSVWRACSCSNMEFSLAQELRSFYRIDWFISFDETCCETLLFVNGMHPTDYVQKVFAYLTASWPWAVWVSICLHRPC